MYRLKVDIAPDDPSHEELGLDPGELWSIADDADCFPRYKCLLYTQPERYFTPPGIEHPVLRRKSCLGGRNIATNYCFPLPSTTIAHILPEFEVSPGG